MKEHRISKINENTWQIDEFGLVNAFLAEGEDKAALIDTGAGLSNIRSAVRKLTDKPLEVLLTHSHSDHSGGLYHFCDTPIHMRSEDEGLQLWGMRTDNEFRRMYVRTRGKERKEELDALIPEGNPDCTYFKYESIEDGMIIDLGSRALKCIHTPGHTDGSVSFLDEKNRLLFSGDTVNRSIILMREKDNSLKKVRVLHDTLLKIRNLSSSFDYLVIGHGSPLLEKSIISDYLEITEGLLSGSLSGKYEERGFRKGDVIRLGSAELWYRCDS